MVLLFSAAYSILVPLSEGPSQFPSQLGPALFGLVSMYESNQSMRVCVDSGAYSNLCDTAINDTMQVYGLQGLSISMGESHMSRGLISDCNYEKSYCIAAEDNGTGYVCVKMCG